MVITAYLLYITVFSLLLNKNKNKKMFLLISLGGLFIIAALRSINFGIDVVWYVNTYEKLSYISINQIALDFIQGNGKDQFFYLISKVFEIIGINHQMWLSILSGIFLVSVYKIIEKYSPIPYLSIIMLISLGFYYFTLTGIRQGLAISIVLLSFDLLRKKRIIPFIIIVFIAALFHASALIFLIAIPIINLDVELKQVAIIILALVVAFFMGDYIRYGVSFIGWTDTLSGYATRSATLNLTGFFIQLSIYLFCFYFRSRLIKSEETNKLLLNLLLLGLVFQSFTIVIAEFFRISLYFSIFSILLVPRSIVQINNKHLRLLIYIVIIVILVFYIYWSGNFSDYEFFWSDLN